MVTKYATGEVTSPEEDREAAERLVKFSIDKMIAREPNVTSRSEMSYSYEDGIHRFCIAIEVEEEAA